MFPYNKKTQKQKTQMHKAKNITCWGQNKLPCYKNDRSQTKQPTRLNLSIPKELELVFRVKKKEKDFSFDFESRK